MVFSLAKIEVNVTSMHYSTVRTGILLQVHAINLKFFSAGKVIVVLMIVNAFANENK